MAALTPCSRSDFIKKLRALGYDGPYKGGSHHFMTKHGAATVTVPNPHGSYIDVSLLRRILRDAKIDRDDWIKA
jgi:predicted RNA binding protein YcfA (HicA-like mRNA interferase family)